MAKRGVKSSTIVHEMVMTLFVLPSCVVTSTTGPGSMSVKTLASFIVRMAASIAVRPHGPSGFAPGIVAYCGSPSQIS